jgi:choline dehydrogenase
VEKILFAGKKATGVKYKRFGKSVSATANKAVILSAGTISSPQILMLSGVGPATHLREKNIDVVIDLPGVGQNFHDHPGTNISVLVNKPTYNVMNSFGHHMLFGARWLFTGNGPGSTPDAHVIGFTRSNPDANRCDVQYHFTPAGYDLAEDGPILFDKPAVTGYTNIHRPWSRGYIELKSNDPFDQPYIQPNLFGDPRDLDTLVAGSRILRKIFAAAPMAQYVESELAPGKEVQSDAEWADYVRASAMGIYHPAGTCKMGIDKMAVVDERLAVRGAENLYVADASIMPIIVSANLNASCIMIGEKCADMLKQN